MADTFIIPFLQGIYFHYEAGMAETNRDEIRDMVQVRIERNVKDVPRINRVGKESITLYSDIRLGDGMGVV